MSPARLLLNERDSARVRVDADGGAVVLFSARNPGKSPENEDCALVFPTEQGAVIAVADGVGGGQEGDRASRLTVEALAECLERDPTRSGILDGFEEANRRVRGLGSGAATTLSVVEISGTELRPYHAGDSSILVVGGRGKVKLLTIAHSPVGYGVEAGFIEPEDALHHADLNLVSNILGTSDMRIEMGSALSLKPHDTVVIGTDGLFDNVELGEVCELARRGPLEQASERLAQLAGDRMQPGGRVPKHGDGRTPVPSKPDDLTFAIYRPTRSQRRSPRT